MEKISISHVNKKMGRIPSVSLPPVVTCAEGCKCAAKCYAAKLCRIYPTVREAYARNLRILREDPSEYWRQIAEAVRGEEFFRFHVSGDIPDVEYLERMRWLAERRPDTQFLAFTKRYSLVNRRVGIWRMGIPKNLHIVFSEWEGMPMDNPHGLPVAHVIFRGEEPHPDWQICEGDCEACARQGKGCWALKSGEHIAFHEH